MCRVNQWPRITGQSEVTKIEKSPKKSFFSQSGARKKPTHKIQIWAPNSGTDLNNLELI